MAETIGTAYVQIEPSFEGSVAKIDKEFGGEGKTAGSSFASGFGSVMQTSAKVMFGAITAGGAVVSGFVKQAVDSFGEYEQLVGGVETLFGNTYASAEEYAKEMGLSAEFAADTWEGYQQRQETVLQNASEAYKTTGMSANEYMETVTGFAASLNSSLGEYAWQSANYAQIAMESMADNANKMGTPLENIKNAYAGFAKGNFTMLDNLKLGYGGTKQEMERLLRDAEKLAGYEEGMLSVDSFADIIDAIDVVQQELGIAGTTAREAGSTIQGSLGMVSAAWANVIAGMGDKDADMTALIGNLVESAETFLGNLLPVVEQSLMGISTLIADLAPVLADKLPGLLQSVLPMLLTAGVQIIETLAQGLVSAIPTLLPTITQLIIELTTMFINMLPEILELGAELILTLATGLAQALPDLIPTIIDVVITITQYLLENIDLLIDCAAQLIIGLANGIVKAIPILIEKVPALIGALVKAIILLIPQLAIAGKDMIIAIKDQIVATWPQIVSKAKELFENLKTIIKAIAEKFIEVGKDIVEGIKKGISNAWEGMTKWFSGLLEGLVDGVKDFFGIGSPSKLMAEEVGQWIPAGIAMGIQEGMKSLDSEFSKMSVNMAPAKLSAQTISTYVPTDNASSDPEVEIVSLLRRYLPVIAEGDKVSISLEGDMGRLFRAMQRESIRNTQLVGNGAVLAAT